MEKDENTKIILFEKNGKQEKREKIKGKKEEEKKEEEKKDNKEKRKRVITISNSWNRFFQDKENDFCKETQLYYLHLFTPSLYEIKEIVNKETEQKVHFLREQIRQKINNYRFQDIKKQIYDTSSFITLEYVLYKLNECNLDCFYCKESVYIWYEIVREPKQWTIERIDNKIGHNIGNIEIACLSCNLKRRCMYHERYVFTKQMRIVKV